MGCGCPRLTSVFTLLLSLSSESCFDICSVPPRAQICRWVSWQEVGVFHTSGVLSHLWCFCVAPDLVCFSGSGSVSTGREAVLLYYLAPLNAAVFVLRGPQLPVSHLRNVLLLLYLSWLLPGGQMDEWILSHRNASETSPMPVYLVCSKSVSVFDPSLYATSCQAWTIGPVSLQVFCEPGRWLWASSWMCLWEFFLLLSLYMSDGFNKVSKYFKHVFLRNFQLFCHWLFVLILGEVRLESFWDQVGSTETF